VVALILRYLNDELDAGTRQALESHLNECPDCAAFLRTYGATASAVHSLSYDDLPPDLQNRALQVVRAKLPKTR
jgi:anti-sigma factor RsiW